ncbi:glycosyltransferase [Candidatus Poribacteria bacterium]|nr:glycosyltransferase [Candidatus Poribacteria bacterium]
MKTFPMEGTDERRKCSPELEAWLDARVGDFDAVHIHSLFSHATQCAAAACIRQRVPYVIAPTGHLMAPNISLRRPRNLFKRLYLRGVEHRHLAKAAAVLFTSTIEKTLSLRSLPREARGRSAIIALGLDEDALRGAERAMRRRKAPTPDQPLRFGFLGRLHRIKGFETWVPALGDAAAAYPGTAFQLHIAGSAADRWTERKLGSLLRAAGLESRTRRQNSVTGEEKWQYLASLDLLLLPSKLENFGMAAIEALACGVPVLATDRVGCMEWIAGAGAGWAVPGNRAELALAFGKLLREPELIAAAQAGARPLAEGHFSHQRLARELLDLYESVTAAGKRKE